MTDTHAIQRRSSTNGGAPRPQRPEDVAPVNRVPAVRTRRRPLIIAIGVMLVGVAVVTAVGLVNTMSHRQEVLVLATDVSQGQALTAEDLTVARVNADAGLHVVLDAQRGEVIGKTVSTNLTAGTVLNPNVLGNAVLPPKGMTVVGITVSADKLPASALQVGDMVRLVDTPRDQDASPVQAPTTTNAQVVTVQLLEGVQGGQITVDVLVPEEEASWVAARAATHRVAIVLDTRER